MKTLAIELLIDVLAIAGAGAIVFGVYQIHEPAAWVVGGLLAMAAAWHLMLGSKR